MLKIDSHIQYVTALIQAGTILVGLSFSNMKRINLAGLWTLDYTGPLIYLRALSLDVGRVAQSV